MINESTIAKTNALSRHSFKSGLSRIAHTVMGSMVGLTTTMLPACFQISSKGELDNGKLGKVEKKE